MRLNDIDRFTKFQRLRLGCMTLCSVALGLGLPVPSNATGTEFGVEFLNEPTEVTVTNVIDIRTTVGRELHLNLAHAGLTAQKVFYRLKWLNRAGKEATQGEPWYQIEMQPLSSEAVTLRSPSNTAEGYRVQISVGSIAVDKPNVQIGR